MRAKALVLIKCALMCLLAAAVGFCGARYYGVKTDIQRERADLEVFSGEAYSPQQFRTERQQLRSMQKAQLNDIIFGSGEDDTAVSMAQEQLLDILKREEMEITLEGLLEMRGFRDAVVSIHRDSASILISADMVTRQESAVILDLVCRETGLLSGNIKIIPIN